MNLNPGSLYKICINPGALTASQIYDKKTYEFYDKINNKTVVFIETKLIIEDEGDMSYTRAYCYFIFGKDMVKLQQYEFFCEDING